MKYLFLVMAVLLSACGESEQERLQKQELKLEQQQQALYQNQQQLQQQLQQQQYQQPGYAQQPVIVQQPATQQAPVVVQQHDNTMSNMLLGALAGNAISNMTNGVNKYTNQSPRYDSGYASQKNITNITNITNNKPRQNVAQPLASNKNYMDMNKLSTNNKSSTKRR